MKRAVFGAALLLLAGAAWAQGPAPALPAPALPAPVQPDWLPQPAAELRLLDKVTARTATLAGKAGETLRFGSLSVVVRQCLIRPPERAADAAAYLEITDADGGRGFKGWMLASAPSLSMLEHSGYDVRVAGCRP